MNPSMELRLASMCRVLADIIIPNLEDELASEQARLVLSHLHVIRQQVDYVVRYEQLQCCALLCLIKDLLKQVAGGLVTQAACAKLRELSTKSSNARLPEEVRKLCDTLNAGVDELLRAGDTDGEDGFRLEARKLVLKEARASALRNRSWFVGMGFENADHLETIPQMMLRLEAHISSNP